MRVFVTGASGFIGSAVVTDLLAAGHQVLGLARSEASAAAVAAAGAAVHHGNLADLESLRRGAESCDAVIHTAFEHDFSKIRENAAHDREVIQTLGAVLRGSDRPLVVTSAVGVLTITGRLATENDRPTSTKNHRIASEEGADAVADTGVRVSVMRLPPSVHSANDHAFVPALIRIARMTGVSAYIGDGSNRWPAVHRTDAARLYRLAIEAPPPPGARLHAIAEEGIPLQEIAGVIGTRLGVPVKSVPPEEASQQFSWITRFIEMDCPASGAWTQQAFGWKPEHRGLLADIDSEAYFPE